MEHTPPYRWQHNKICTAHQTTMVFVNFCLENTFNNSKSKGQDQNGFRHEKTGKDLASRYPICCRNFQAYRVTDVIWVQRQRGKNNPSGNHKAKHTNSPVPSDISF